MRERLAMQKAEQYFSPEESSSFNGGVLGESAWKLTFEKSLQNKKDENSAQNMEITMIDDLEVPYLPMKTASLKIST